jgi:D-xylose transport system ATP-binding protein
MSEYLLEMRGISKSFGAVRALKNVNLQVFPGEMHALCGGNGAGKSTLMKVLDGYYPHGDYEGEILLSGTTVHIRNPGDASHHGIAMVYQEIAIHDDLSVAENLFVGGLPSRWGVVSKRRLFAEAEALLSQVGLDVDARKNASRLSASQHQLLMIAKALVRKPKILVLDEPTSALTFLESRNLHRILDDLKRSGVTCIYISHKMEEVFEIADRITVLRDGETIETFDQDGFAPNRVITAMVGREVESLYPKEHVPPGEEILRVENLSVPHPHRPDLELIKEVSFSVRRGEILGIAGLVGSGRSELLGAIYGAAPRTHGEIFVDGKNIKVNGPRDALAHGIALLTEDRHKTGLIAGASVAQNLTLASLAAISRFSILQASAERRTASTMVEDLRIKTSSVSSPVRQLSGGNQQKVALGKWLLTKPRVLLLDEPTRGIDVESKSELYKLIGRLASQGVAIVMVSSELPELLEMCDRFIVLAGGHIVDSFPRSEANAARVMLAATGAANKVNTSYEVV